MAQQTTDKVLAGRYRLIERLGSGGMASVWLAEDQRLGRRVAIKRLHAHSPDDMAQRFRREAQLLARLNHPNVVAVYDTIAGDEGVLIVMECVPGESLREALDRGPLPVQRAVEVVSGIAQALDHGHSNGIVHRDVKPANVLLRPDGGVKLADFGIARAAERTQITSTGTVLGTAAYMAPEQLDGGEPEPPADIYALGAVAFETLSGRKAREGRTPVEIAHLVATTPAPDLREAWPEAPPEAARVLARAMATDPRERPETAAELARDLERALAQRERTAGTAPLPRAAVVEARPRRGLPIWVPLLALAAAAAFVVAIASGGGEDEQPRSRDTPAERDRADRSESRSSEEAEPRERPESESAPAPAPAGGVDEGLQLQQAGFDAMQAGRYDEAIEASRRAVELLRGTGRIEYAYALFNLGRSLRLAGRPAEAIPVLEERLGIPNQTDAVEQELTLARAAAGGGGGDDTEDKKEKEKDD